MKPTLKTSIKEYYKSKGLTEAQFKRLSKITDEHGLRPRYGRRVLIGIAAALAVTMYGAFLYQRSGGGDPYDRITAEISKNHGKRLEMEVVTDSYTHVHERLTKLDFGILPPSRLPAATWRLVGGRYCSVQGRMAVQMRLQNEQSGSLYTLYEVPIPDGLKGMTEPVVRFYDGAKITLWLENGLLFGLAGPP